ncbi:hypothetical protein [Neogemmobacter tilapiae]|uniref:hypothetical protein n=1 Tax=Neogemmobacter tilapiae TaxID=875041 RepID=UPI001E50F892|nr:hypothetical protein [Gemmobacter tilapiae]
MKVVGFADSVQAAQLLPFAHCFGEVWMGLVAAGRLAQTAREANAAAAGDDD